MKVYVPSRRDAPAFISTSLISSSSWSLIVMLLGRRPEDRVETSRNPPVAISGIDTVKYLKALVEKVVGQRNS